MRSPERHPFVRAVRSARSRSRARRRTRIFGLFIGATLCVGALGTFWPRAQAASDGTFRDEFDSVSLSGSSGTLAWTGPWVELGESDGPGTGAVTVATWASRCAVGNCLRINDITTGTPYGVQRSADLSGAAAATLTFSYTLEQDNPGGSTFVLQAAPGASGPWTTLTTYQVTGTHTAPIPEVFDVTPYISAATTIRVMSDGVGLSNEIYLDDVQVEAVPGWRTRPALWFSIRDDTTSGPPALPALKDGAVASFSSPGLNYQPGATTGTLGIIADWDAAFANLDLRGLHLVGTTLTVGGVTLQPGDLLFTVGADASLPGGSGSVTIGKADVGRFRPSSPGVYTSGTFSILLQNPLGAEVRGVTLVEKPTQVGEVTLPAGSFLLIRAGGAEHSDVYRYLVTSAGPGSTSGSVSKLIEGTEMGFSDQVWGIDLIEEGMGWPFPRGAIVLTVEKPVLVGIDGLAAPKRTLFSVIVARTSLSGSARVNAILAWDGNDLGFDEDKERVDGFTFAFLDVPPVFDSDIQDRTDLEGTSISFSATATDPLGQGLTYSAVGLPPGISYHPTTGLVSGWIHYTADSASPYSVTLTATDPGGNTAIDTFVWTVVNVNRPPEVDEHDDVGGAEGDGVTLALTGFDPDGDPAVWSATGLPPGLAIDPATGVISGSISYDASPGSPYTVTVRLTDDGSPPLWDEDVFTWTVADTNRPPQVADPGDQTSAEGDVVNLALVASDPDGDDLTWVALGLPSGLAIHPLTGVVSGTLPYDAAPGSPYTVEIRVFDDGSPTQMTNAFFDWVVTDTNRAPIVTNPGDRSNAEGDPVTFAVAGSDPDGDDLAWTATGLPSGLAIDPQTGVISGTIAYDAAGNHAVVVRATDDGTPQHFGEVAFGWSVGDTNRAPMVSDPGDQADAEGDTVSLPVTGSDPDLDTLTWTASGLPPGLTIDAATGVIAGTIAFDGSGASPYAVVVRATDNGTPILFTEVAFSWAVADTNRAPIVTNPGDRSNAEGDPVTFAIDGSDPDGDTVTWSATGLPDGVSIDPATGVVSGSLTFVASEGSPFAVTVRATDDGSPVLFTEVAFSWSVANTNRAPVAVNPDEQSSAEGDAVSLAMTGSDPDGDTVSWSAAGLPPGLVIDPDTGTISGTLPFTASPGSPYAVTVRATDDGSPVLFTEVAFSWSVANTNRVPVVVNPGGQSSAEGSAISLPISGSDPDGDNLVWSAFGLPAGLSISASTGTISGTISYDASPGSPYTVTVRATDDGSPVLFTEVAFTWSVSNTNRAPVVGHPGTQASAEGTTIALAISGFDPDADTLVWSATDLPAGLSISAATGTISGTISYDASPGSPYAVTVRATDDGSPALFTEVAFTWSVANTNRAPVVANPGNQSGAEGASVALGVVGSDPDGDALTWSAVGLPGGLSIAPTTGHISGSLSFTAAGTHAVTVRAADNGTPALFTEVSFTWSVSNTNRAPSLLDPGTQASSEGDTVSLAVVASDPDGDAITFAASGLPPGLTISSTTGVVSGALGYSLGDQYTVTISATDNGVPSLQSLVTFTWMIAEINRPPVVAAIGNRTTEQGVATTISVAVSEPDGDAIVWSVAGLPSGVTFSPVTGIMSGTPQVPGVYGVVVTATDDGSPPASHSRSFTWTIVSAPGFPEIEGIGTRRDLDGSFISFRAEATHPDGLALTWSAEGLPTGVRIDPASGRISGLVTTPGTWFARVTVTDSRGQAAAASFVWVVEPKVDLPPVTTDDVIRVGIDQLTEGGVALDPAGNDVDPEGLPLRVVSVGPAPVGTVELVDGMVVFHPPTGWLGTVSIDYVVEDPAGNQAEGTITITVEDALAIRLGTRVLPTDTADLGRLGAITPSAGTDVLLGSLFQSLTVLRVPLALLGGAVFWSLLLGGILNLGFVFRGGLPRLVRRSAHRLAVVMVPQGGRVDIVTEPLGTEVVGRLTATQRGVEATGRRAIASNGEEWAEIRIEAGLGWVPAIVLTEEVDRTSFAGDPEVDRLVREFIARLRVRHSFADLVSEHGLFVAHHAPLVHFPVERLPAIMDDPSTRVWKGRNPAYPDFVGTFDLAVATGLLDAMDHPQREISPDAPAVPSTVIPVEFTNFHFVSIGADLHGLDRLDQSAWLVVIAYETSRPRIIGLVREG